MEINDMDLEALNQFIADGSAEIDRLKDELRPAIERRRQLEAQVDAERLLATLSPEAREQLKALQGS